MAAGNRWPVAVIPVGPLRAASLLWRVQGQLHTTVMVKARLWLRHGELAALASPVDVVTRDSHHGGSPLRSLRQASDLAPYRQRCDVWLVGHCYGKPRQPVSSTTARLALYQGQRALLDKSLNIFGDRSTDEEEPAPFERMPLVYERAFGGIGVLNNPVGVGMRIGDPEPNIVHPKFPSRPAGFGPIARYWRARAFELSDEVRRGLEQAVIQIPGDFDWGYYQTAPRDQQVVHLEGDEWIVLDGLHPNLSRLQCRLPSLQARARLWSHRAAPSTPGQEIGLVADTLAIDTDEQTCTVMWRGSFPLQSEELLSTIRVGVGVATRDQTIDWAPFWKADPAEYAQVPPSEDADIDIDASGTVVIHRPELDEATTLASPTSEPATEKVAPELPNAAGAAPEADLDPLSRTALLAPDAAAPALDGRHAAPFDLAQPAPHTPRAPLRPASLPGAPWDEAEPATERVAAESDGPPPQPPQQPELDCTLESSGIPRLAVTPQDGPKAGSTSTPPDEGSEEDEDG